MGIDAKERGNVRIPAVPELERFQARIQPALLFIEHAQEQQNGGLCLLHGQVRVGDDHGGRLVGRGMNFAAFTLLLGNGIVGRKIDKTLCDDLAMQSTLAGQPGQGVFRFHVKSVCQLCRAIPGLRAMYPRRGGLDQVAEA